MKCSTYPFCECGAQLMAAVKDEVGDVPTFVRFRVFGEEPDITTQVATGASGARKLLQRLNGEVYRIPCATPSPADADPEAPERLLGFGGEVAVYHQVDGKTDLMVRRAGRGSRETRSLPTEPGAA